VIVQTKDIRFGVALLPLIGAHRSLLEERGLCLITQFLWQDPFHSSSSSARAMLTRQLTNDLQSSHTESFLIFSGNEGLIPKEPASDVTPEVFKVASEPVWRLPGPGGRKTHRYESPDVVIKRLIHLFSVPGDLVVDPFAGHGTTMRVAYTLGRRSIGYELDHEHANVAKQRLERLRQQKATI
jgi:adenine specific DNA methylase Mod